MKKSILTISFKFLFCFALHLLCYEINAQEKLNIQVYNQENVPLFQTNFFRHIVVTMSGDVWVGTNGYGVYKFNRESWQQTLPSHQVRSIIEDREGHVWVASGMDGVKATMGGVRSYTWGLFENITTYNVTNSGLISRYVNGLSANHENSIYVAHGQSLVNSTIEEGGLGIIKNDSYSRVLNQELPTSDRRILVVEAKGSDVWLGVDRSCDKGICQSAWVGIFDKDQKLLKKFNKQTNPEVFTDDMTVPRAIWHDANGKTWLGFNNGKIAVSDGVSLILLDKSPLPANTAINFHAIKGHSDIWIGTTGGLLKIAEGAYENANAWTLYTIENGLPSNNIMGVSLKANHIWLATGAGVADVEMGLYMRGVVSDVDAYTPTGKLIRRPMSGVKVKLIKDGVILEEKDTDADGKFEFAPEKLQEKRLYTLDFYKENTRLSHQSVIRNLQPSPEQLKIDMPLALKGRLLDSLVSVSRQRTHTWKFYGVDLFTTTIGQYNTQVLQGQITGPWKKIEDKHVQTQEAMLRSLISTDMVGEYFVESEKLVGNTAQSITDALVFVDEFIGDFKKGVKNPKELDEKIAKGKIENPFTDLAMFSYLYNNLVKDAVREKILASSKDPNVKKALNVALDQAELLIFEDEKEVDGKNFEARVQELFSNVLATSAQNMYYLRKSQEYLDKTYTDALSNTLEKGYSEAAAKAYEDLHKTKADNESSMLKGELAQDLASSWKSQVYNAPGLNFFKLFTTTAGIPILASHASAVYFYNSRYFSLLSELEQAQELAMHGRKATGLNTNDNTAEIEILVQKYNDELLKIKERIKANNELEASSLIAKVRPIEASLIKSVRNSRYNLFAAAAASELSKSAEKIYFSSQYNLDHNTAKQLAFNYDLHKYFAATNNTGDLKEAALVSIDSLIASNLKLPLIAKAIGNTFTGAIPATIKVVQVVQPDTIRQNSNFKFSISYKNYGTVMSTPFNIVLATSPDLSIQQKTINAAALAPGEERVLELNVQAGNLTDIAFINAVFELENPYTTNIILQAGSELLVACSIPTPVITVSGPVLTSSSVSGNQWYLNGTAIEGATSQTYTATETGIYTVQVSGSCGVSEMSEAVSYTVTAIGDELEQNIKVYPNPTNDKLFIEMLNNVDLEKLGFYSAQGKLLFEIDKKITSKSTLNVKQYAKGLYFLQLQTKKGIVYKKVVLE